MEKMTPSKILFYLCISFIAGVFLQFVIKTPHIFLWGFLIVGFLTIIISFLFAKNNFTIIGFCILFLILGAARFQIAEFNISNDKISRLNDSFEKITLTGQIAGEPDDRDSFQKLKIKIDNSESVVLITTGRYPEYEYLDSVKVTGKLKTPKVFDDFNYKNYLMKDGIYSVMDFPEMELVSDKRNYNILFFAYEKILFFKKKLKQSININFSPPHSFLLSGIILGDDKNMSAELKNKLSATGLSHLTAISGSNVVVLGYIATIFLLFLGFWRGQAFYFSVAFVWLYVIVAGLPASGVRAAIMATVFLLAQKLGRQNTSSRAIIFTAALMLAQNPLLLPYDIGFQLSFLASLGIIHLKPLIDDLFVFVFQKTKNKEQKTKNSFYERIKKLRDIFSITIAAQIFTLPIIAYNFKQLSLVAPITNLIIIPIIDWIMVLGFLAAISGIFSGILGFIFFIPCWFLLNYFLWTVNFFAQTWASKNIDGFSPIWISLYYSALVIFIIFLQKRQKPKFLRY